MTQSLFDFSAYFKFFIGLFALVNPVGIIPVFISMTSYQPAAVRNKTNLTANLSVAIILLTSLFLGDGILQIFGISIDSFRIAVFALCCWGIFRMAPWLVRLLGQTGINVITRIMGLLLMALGIEFIVTGIKALFPGLLS